ncbi:MAG: zeta toxin family protein [Pirellulaceae bacterium]|nr:zeta toxin family protein [Pirellulaceae bacterium]
MKWDFLDRRPIVVAIAGPNGSGKTTFYHSHLAESGLRFVNADALARQLQIGPYEAAEAAAAIRSALIASGESFIFETVLSDPVGDKVGMLSGLAEQGYEVVLIYIQIPDSQTSIERVSMRVNQGGHDVPDDKLLTRFERSQANLTLAIEQLPHVIIFDNSDLARPYRHRATYRRGNLATEMSSDDI